MRSTSRWPRSLASDWLTTGGKAAELEKRFSGWVDGSYGCSVKEHPKAQVLMVVHFVGQAAQMMNEDGQTGLLSLCRERGVRILEDAAHAFPTRRAGRMVGSFGDVTCFSFYANKTITTGEGGMLVTEDEEIWQRVKRCTE